MTFNLRTLRDYQMKPTASIQAIIAASAPFRGLVVLPTGGGKTEVFLTALLPLIQRRNKLKETVNVVLIYPRIALANEQLNRFRSTFPGVTFFQFHSGDVIQQDKFEAAELKRLKIGGTNVDTFETQLENSGVKLRFIFTTYHSAAKIAHLGNVFVFDEAHHLVANKAFGEIFHVIPAEAKCFFFTATPAKKGELDMGAGDDPDNIVEGSPEFGNCLARVLPIELIERGYIVPPKLLEADIVTKGAVKKNADDTILNLHEVASRVFADQAKRVREMSNGRLTPKLLVAAKGTKHFNELHKKLSDIRTMCGEDVDVYSVTAASARKNGSPWKSRELLIADFNTNPKPCIIVHYDTLAEGIDVAGLTGVLILRRLSKIKFLQTIGRALRAYAVLDFDENGEPVPYEQRAKKCAFVTIPNVNSDLEWIRIAEGYAKALTNYGDLLEILSEVDFGDNGEEDDEQDDFYDGCMKKPSWISTMMTKERNFAALERFFS